MNGAVFDALPDPQPFSHIRAAASARPSAITTALWRMRLLISERCCSAPDRSHGGGKPSRNNRPASAIIVVGVPDGKPPV
jgi:hypothetical protein